MRAHVLDAETDGARLVELGGEVPVVHRPGLRQMAGQAADQLVIALSRLLMVEDAVRLRRQRRIMHAFFDRRPGSRCLPAEFGAEARDIIAVDLVADIVPHVPDMFAAMRIGIRRDLHRSGIGTAGIIGPVRIEFGAEFRQQV